MGKLVCAQYEMVSVIDGSARIDCTERVFQKLVLEIPEGVTLASNRGQNNSRGAMLFSGTFATSPLIRCDGSQFPHHRATHRRPESETVPRTPLHRFPHQALVGRA